MTISAVKSNHIADPMYSEVVSWMLDFDGNEVDERTHGFVVNSRLTPEQRAIMISDLLGQQCGAILTLSILTKRLRFRLLRQHSHFRSLACHLNQIIRGV